MKEGTKHLSHQMCTSLSNQHCCSLSCSGTDTSGAFQVALVVKNPPANTGDTGSMPGSGRPPGEGNGNPFPYTCLENPMDRGAWRATVHGVTETNTMEPVHASAHTYLWKTRKKLVEIKAKSCLKSVVVLCCPPPRACMVPSRDRKWGRRRGQRKTEGELNLSLLAWVLTPTFFLPPVE